MHEAREALIIVQRIFAQGLGDKARVARFDFDHRALVLVRVKIDVLALAHESMEERGEFGEPLDAANSARLAALLLS